MKGINAVNCEIDDKIEVVLFDYGGVLAEEGFREGLMEIGRANGLSPESFFEQAAAAVYETGYVTGHAEESVFWDTLRKRTGIRGTDEDLRIEILTRFVLRPWILDIVRLLRDQGVKVAILSDQSNWLDELDRRDDFFQDFHCVYNSFHVGKGKMDATLFADVAEHLGVSPAQILFIDDNEGHIGRARELGFRVIHYQDKESVVTGLISLGLLT
jgi:putative hydrolase of the HAD superfamily